MKKTLLALSGAALALASTAASPAVVYDRDGTTLALGGRVQALFFSGSNNYVENRDATILNNSRLNISGRSQLAPGIAAIGFAEWHAADGDSTLNNGLTAREQFVGVDFGKFGVLKAGRAYDAAHEVLTVTDIFEEYSVETQSGGADRRPGTFKYIWEGFGVTAGFSYQAAKNDLQISGGTSSNTFDAEGGVSVLLGYTTPSVLFGPVSIKAAYSYFEGQNDPGSGSVVDKVKDVDASITWGRFSGLYFALVGQQRKFEYNELGDVDERTVKTVEFAGSYTFDSSLSIRAGYQYKHAEDELGSLSATAIQRQIPVYVEYQFSDNFKVFAEAAFDVGSDKNVTGDLAGVSTLSGRDDSARYSLAARYTF